jgi:hypothetical protein
MKTNTLLLFVLVIIGIAGCDKAIKAEPDPLEDAKKIVPEEYLNIVMGMGMVLHGGSNSIQMNGIITQETPIVIFDNTDKKKEGDKLRSYLFSISRQTGKNLRLLTGPNDSAHSSDSYRMSGDGIVSSPEGHNFTIYARTEGRGPIGRSEYKIIYIMTGAIKGNKIVNFQYAYIVMENQGVSFIEEEGTIIITQYAEADWSPSW